jgi:lysophospholipid acyltransferase (LPLAT)-like uncharacterized protein
MRLTKRIIRSEFVKKIVCKLAYLYIKFVLFTSKVEIIYNNFDFRDYEKKQSIFATWHGRVVILPIINPSKLRSCGIVSDHNDGRLIGGVIEQAGVELIFGSSNRRRISALKEIMSCIKKGRNFLITPDGPRGPSREINSAVVHIASFTGLPIIAASFSAKYSKLFRTWDQFMLPFPFNQIVVILDKPFEVPMDLTIEEKNKYNFKLRDHLNYITKLADEKICR